ncbi:hypothetical protein [Sphingobium sp. LMC3-1-1.1]|uniref:hypothetical protein n=1 Tax=Sphingobium sp. LMC3-1-1.1 TaxID=3135241 RepID=UPI00343192D4
MMKRIFLVLAVGALAGSAVTALAQDSNPAIKDSKVTHVGHAAEGANSFTEDQARGRLTKAGYTKISDLRKDDKGHWVGTAVKKGKKSKVALDYKGNVTVLPHNK